MSASRALVRAVNTLTWVVLLVAIYYFLNLVGISVQDLVNQMYSILTQMIAFTGM